MPMIRYPKRLFSDQTYSSLTATQRITLIEICILSPVKIDEAHEVMGERLSAIEALIEKNLIAKNATFYVSCTDLFKQDNNAFRVAICKEKKRNTVEEVPEPEPEKLKMVRKQPIPFLEIAKIYNTELAIPKGLIQCIKVDSPKRINAITFAYNYFKKDLADNNIEVSEENILLKFKLYFNYLSTDQKAVFLKSDTWTGSLEYCLRSEKFCNAIDAAKTARLEQQQRFTE